MKKFLLAIASVAAMSFVANAEPVTLNVNDAEDIQGTWVDEKVSGTQTTAAHYQPLTSLMLGGYTFEFSSTNTNANSQPAYYHATSTNENQQKTIRVYKDTKMTITAPEGVTMYAIDTKGSNGKTTYTGTCNNGTWTFASTSTTTWKGETNKLEVTFSGTYRITELTITTGEGGDTPVIPDTKTVLYSENFKAGFGTWTTENVTLPEGLTYVWTSTAQYGAKASAFANKTTYAADSYLVSEVFDFTKVTEPVLTFSQAMNMFTSIETAKQECSVLARVEGATEWTALTVPTYPSSLSWGFVETGDIDLAAYAGKKFQIAFRYTSTAAKAGTWEVTDFVLKGIGELPQPEVETSNATRATSAEAGTYFFTIGNEVAGNLAETATYGFLPLTDKNATFTAGKLTAPSAYGIAIKAADEAGYFTLTDTFGRFLGMDDEHLTSFQLYTEVNEGCYWTIAIAADGKATIYNETADATLCKSKGAQGTFYTTLAPCVLGDKEEGTDYVLPILYIVDGTSAAATIEADFNAPVEYYNLQGIRVANPENGIFIRRQGNKATKVLVK